MQCKDDKHTSERNNQTLPLRQSRSRALVVVAALTTGIANAWASDLGAEIDSRLAACESAGSESCKDSIEETALQTMNGKVARSENALTIKIDKAPVVLKNQRKSDTDFIAYRYLGYFADIDYHLVQHFTLESQRFIMISQASGKQAPLGAVPHVSPERTRLISVAASESDDTNELVVWKVMPGQLVEEFRHEPKDYALYKFLGWIGESGVKLENYTASSLSLCPKGNKMTIKEELRLISGKWKRIVDMSPKTVKCH